MNRLCARHPREDLVEALDRLDIRRMRLSNSTVLGVWRFLLIKAVCLSVIRRVQYNWRACRIPQDFVPHTTCHTSGPHLAESLFCCCCSHSPLIIDFSPCSGEGLSEVRNVERYEAVQSDWRPSLPIFASAMSSSFQLIFFWLPNRMTTGRGRIKS